MIFSPCSPPKRPFTLPDVKKMILFCNTTIIKHFRFPYRHIYRHIRIHIYVCIQTNEMYKTMSNNAFPAELVWPVIVLTK